MEPNSLAVREGPERHLLEEGMRSYLQATAAIVSFEREIQKVCREALERHLDEYVDALQPPGELNAKEIRDYLSPSTEKFDGSWRNVGAAIEGKRFDSTVKW